MKPKHIVVCLGCCCPQNGGIDIFKRLKAASRLRDDVIVQFSGCMGPCSEGPNVVVDGVLHTRVKHDSVEALLSENTVSPQHR
ncbi:(2Fe-2S) ferredoxin domain-containing protein [Candidatus Woesearchaeota archaeon]|nr:(2Fe-2S) ferredoxin domain-containing protein [Candidatus Woesearchaeota archaeon]